MMVELMQNLNPGTYFDARRLHEMAFLTRVKPSRMRGLIQKLNSDGQGCCTFYGFMKWLNDAKMSPILPLKARDSYTSNTATVDVDAGVARNTSFSEPLRMMLESHAINESDALDFTDKIVYASYGADKANMLTVAVETAALRLMDMARYVNAPHAAHVQHMGNHEESLATIYTMLSPFKEELEDLHKNGISWTCPGPSCCCACRAEVPLSDGGHVLPYWQFLLADMLWTKTALGLKATICSACGEERGHGADGGYSCATKWRFTPEYNARGW